MRPPVASCSLVDLFVELDPATAFHHLSARMNGSERVEPSVPLPKGNGDILLAVSLVVLLWEGEHEASSRQELEGSKLLGGLFAVGNGPSNSQPHKRHDNDACDEASPTTRHRLQLLLR